MKAAIDTTPMVARIVECYVNATEDQVSAGIVWYSSYQHTLERIAADHGHTLPTVAGLFAVLSPQMTPQRNLALLRAVLDMGAHDVRVRITAHQRTACAAILESDGTYAHVAPFVTGPKVSAFYANLCGDYSVVCVDRHAASIAHGEHLSNPKPSELRGVADAFTIAAGVLDADPAVIQAVTWVAYRASTRGIVDPDLVGGTVRPE